MIKPLILQNVYICKSPIVKYRALVHSSTSLLIKASLDNITARTSFSSTDDRSEMFLSKPFPPFPIHKSVLYGGGHNREEDEDHPEQVQPVWGLEGAEGGD